MTPLRRRLIDDMTLHGLKPKTIQAYVDCIARFARHFGKSPEVLGTAEIRSYLLYLTHDRHVASSTYNQALCALKFLYRVTLRKDWGLDGLARTRRQTKLPVVLSPAILGACGIRSTSAFAFWPLRDGKVGGSPVKKP